MECTPLQTWDGTIRARALKSTDVCMLPMIPCSRAEKGIRYVGFARILQKIKPQAMRSIFDHPSLAEVESRYLRDTRVE